MLEPDTAWRTPSPRLLTLRRLEVGVVAVLLSAGLFALLVSTNVWAAAIAAVVALVGGAVGEVVVSRRVRSWGYAEREEDLLVRRGVLFFRMSVIPYGRMQFIDVSAGPLERVFGLATVRMHTAAAASDARIPGLAVDEAARVRDRLAELGESLAAGL
jgi:membrane protein YdbS with pleckstrin-like domain